MATIDRNLAAGKAARDAAAMEQRWAEAREWMGEADPRAFDLLDELLDAPDPRTIALAMRGDPQVAFDLRYLAVLAWDELKRRLWDEEIGVAADGAEASDA